VIDHGSTWFGIAVTLSKVSFFFISTYPTASIRTCLHTTILHLASIAVPCIRKYPGLDQESTLCERGFM
jgi:hypothetical protein